jgi:hypothetical protein
MEILDNRLNFNKEHTRNAYHQEPAAKLPLPHLVLMTYHGHLALQEPPPLASPTPRW